MCRIEDWYGARDMNMGIMTQQGILFGGGGGGGVKEWITLLVKYFYLYVQDAVLNLAWNMTFIIYVAVLKAIKKKNPLEIFFIIWHNVWAILLLP